jgi:hypothetical protein
MKTAAKVGIVLGLGGIAAWLLSRSGPSRQPPVGPKPEVNIWPLPESPEPLTEVPEPSKIVHPYTATELPEGAASQFIPIDHIWGRVGGGKMPYIKEVQQAAPRLPGGIASISAIFGPKMFGEPTDQWPAYLIEAEEYFNGWYPTTWLVHRSDYNLLIK